MQFVLMFNEPAEIFAERVKPEMADYWGAWGAYLGAMKDAGCFVGGAGLEPPATAVTVRSEAGGRLVQDGPVSATKEQLGGFAILELPDLEAALQWAARAPAAAYGAVEVRAAMTRRM